MSDELEEAKALLEASRQLMKKLDALLEKQQHLLNEISKQQLENQGREGKRVRNKKSD